MQKDYKAARLWKRFISGARKHSDTTLRFDHRIIRRKNFDPIEFANDWPTGLSNQSWYSIQMFYDEFVTSVIFSIATQKIGCKVELQNDAEKERKLRLGQVRPMSRADFRCGSICDELSADTQSLNILIPQLFVLEWISTAAVATKFQGTRQLHRVRNSCFTSE